MKSLSKNTVTIKCPVCGSGSDSVFIVVKGFNVASCSECRFVFVNPRPTEDSLVTVYADRKTKSAFNSEHEPMEFERPVLSRLLQKIRSHSHSGRLLEVGCGRGDFLRLAQAEGFSVYGCDIFGDDRPAIGDISFHDGPLIRAEFPQNYFDLVVARNVLEHLFDPAVELREIRRVLKTRGKLYVKVPNFDFEYGILCRLLFRRQHLLNPPYHLNHFRTSSLREVLEKTGFKFVSWEVEQPTLCKNGLSNLKRQAAYRVAQILCWLSAGRLFPRVTLACFAEKNTE